MLWINTIDIGDSSMKKKLSILAVLAASVLFGVLPGLAELRATLKARRPAG